jgi:hypothetical protein
MLAGLVRNYTFGAFAYVVLWLSFCTFVVGVGLGMLYERGRARLRRGRQRPRPETPTPPSPDTPGGWSRTNWG